MRVLRRGNGACPLSRHPMFSVVNMINVCVCLQSTDANMERARLTKFQILDEQDEQDEHSVGGRNSSPQRYTMNSFCT